MYTTSFLSQPGSSRTYQGINDHFLDDRCNVTESVIPFYGMAHGGNFIGGASSNFHRAAAAAAANAADSSAGSPHVAATFVQLHNLTVIYGRPGTNSSLNVHDRTGYDKAVWHSPSYRRLASYNHSSTEAFGHRDGHHGKPSHENIYYIPRPYALSHVLCQQSLQKGQLSLCVA